MPTGSGKTHVFTYIAVSAAKKGFRTLIVVHRSYLWQQVSRKLSEIGVSHGVIAPGQTKTNDLIQIASIDTVIRRLRDISEPNAIIFDEGHHVIKKNKWGKLANFFSSSKIIGVTATACRTNGQGLGIDAGGFYDVLIYGPQIADLIPEYLTPFQLYAPNIGIDTKNIRIIAGDYEKSELNKRVDQKKIYGNVPLHYNKICPGVPAIAFCVSVKHAEHVANEFNMVGIPANAVSGKTPEWKRRMLFDGLSNGRYKVLCSCDLVSEGFDVPVCGAAICLRPTQSTTLCLQQWGRTTRIAPGKKYAYIIDHVGNYLRHGYPDNHREWDLSGIKFKTKNTEEPSVLTRVCPRCFVVHRPSPICPGCGYKYSELEVLPKIDEKAELVKIATAHQLKIEKNKKRIALITSAKSLKELYHVADELKYKHGWADFVWQSRIKKFKEAKTISDLHRAAYLIGYDGNIRDEWNRRREMAYKENCIT